MPELAPEFAANLAFVAIALLGWGLEHRWRDRRTSGRRRVAYCLFGLIIAGSFADAIATWHSHDEVRAQHEQIARIGQGVEELLKRERERNPGLTEEEVVRRVDAKVRAITSEWERKLESLRRYSSVAKLNGLGVSGMVGPGSGLKETTPISRALEGAYIRKDVGGQEKHFPRCDKKGIAAFRKAAEVDPDFPFSFWALAMCARKDGNKEWRRYAERAVTILEHTTQIAGHNGHHDQVLEELRNVLARP